ncbi:hypothetical protein HAX54_005136, partial [Datura stramonium]|nr:hypothetical protein [Datura stramonium]
IKDVELASKLEREQYFGKRARLTGRDNSYREGNRKPVVQYGLSGHLSEVQGEQRVILVRVKGHFHRDCPNVDQRARSSVVRPQGIITAPPRGDQARM